MKKLLLLALIALCIGIIIPQKLYATDISVGASTWYAWWDAKQGGEKVECDPKFLYGPALAVKFNEDFNLTFIYLYGKFDMTNSYYDGSLSKEVENKQKIKRNDADLALNYRLNDFFKVFAGVKYNTYSFTGMDFVGVGPGLGLSAAYPITADLFIIANVSGFYLWGDYDEDKHGKSDAKQYGYNSTLSFAYYIAPASTTISLGGRYQYMKVKYVEDFQDNQRFDFYGVTLTATYTFSI